MKTYFIKISLICLVSILTLVYSPAYAQDGMTNRKMDRIINRISPKVEGELGGWQAVIGNRLVYIITDKNANRMRIMTPVIEMKKVKKKELTVLLEANFDRALDAKYCIFESYLMTVYTHPLKELTEDQFIDAVKQVVVLANNYGGSYTSTDMVFGGEQ